MRGQSLAVVSAAFGLLGTVCYWGYFASVKGNPESGWVFLLLVAAMVCTITCLTSAAFAYTNWVPKWEREEKRTGRVPGDRKVSR